MTALTNTLNPTTSSTLTIRVIKNFEYRTVKNMVLQNVNLETTTVEQLKEIIREKINTTPGFKPFRNVNYDTLKVYTKAHGAKPTNLVINFEHDEDWLLNYEHSALLSYGIENETEISFFNFEAYEKYKEHPDIQWD
ncbi:6626_t:CDS:2 [Paraglomus brasilianum]|uniref:6626_t:CDS:1 n=1 Tax=Paraglomus brasilianum TaxID=144538 RepID=A0A9N9C1Z7_9GLOM|nr:6626_t:CDS:2 [Paraglomus brasilianum]